MPKDKNSINAFDKNCIELRRHIFEPLGEHRQREIDNSYTPSLKGTMAAFLFFIYLLPEEMQEKAILKLTGRLERAKINKADFYDKDVKSNAELIEFIKELVKQKNLGPAIQDFEKSGGTFHFKVSNQELMDEYKDRLSRANVPNLDKYFEIDPEQKKFCLIVEKKLEFKFVTIDEPIGVYECKEEHRVFESTGLLEKYLLAENVRYNLIQIPGTNRTYHVFRLSTAEYRESVPKRTSLDIVIPTNHELNYIYQTDPIEASALFDSKKKYTYNELSQLMAKYGVLPTDFIKLKAAHHDSIKFHFPQLKCKLITEDERPGPFEYLYPYLSDFFSYIAKGEIHWDKVGGKISDKQKLYGYDCDPTNVHMEFSVDREFHVVYKGPGGLDYVAFYIANPSGNMNTHLPVTSENESSLEIRARDLGLSNDLKNAALSYLYPQRLLRVLTVIQEGNKPLPPEMAEMAGKIIQTVQQVNADSQLLEAFTVVLESVKRCNLLNKSKLEEMLESFSTLQGRRWILGLREPLKTLEGKGYLNEKNFFLIEELMKKSVNRDAINLIDIKIDTLKGIACLAGILFQAEGVSYFRNEPFKDGFEKLFEHFFDEKNSQANLGSILFILYLLFKPYRQNSEKGIFQLIDSIIDSINKYSELDTLRDALMFFDEKKIFAEGILHYQYRKPLDRIAFFIEHPDLRGFLETLTNLWELYASKNRKIEGLFDNIDKNTGLNRMLSLTKKPFVNEFISELKKYGLLTTENWETLLQSGDVIFKNDMLEKLDQLKDKLNRTIYKTILKKLELKVDYGDMLVVSDSDSDSDNSSDSDSDSDNSDADDMSLDEYINSLFSKTGTSSVLSENNDSDDLSIATATGRNALIFFKDLKTFSTDYPFQPESKGQDEKFGSAFIKK